MRDLLFFLGMRGPGGRRRGASSWNLFLSVAGLGVFLGRSGQVEEGEKETSPWFWMNLSGLRGLLKGI